jgi:hypothetical protein
MRKLFFCEGIAVLIARVGNAQVRAWIVSSDRRDYSILKYRGASQRPGKADRSVAGLR